MKSYEHLIILSLMATFAAPGVHAQQPDDGSMLPFPGPPMGRSIGDTMQESVHKWRVARERVLKPGTHMSRRGAISR
jgi:hypothetical protein